MIELFGLDKKGIKLEECSEIKDTLSALEYINYITPKQTGKVFRKDIRLQIPCKIDAERGIMIVKIGKCRKVVKGLYGPLLAIFYLVLEFQKGTLYCRYCKRTLPEQCQIAALLNFISI